MTLGGSTLRLQGLGFQPPEGQLSPTERQFSASEAQEWATDGQVSGAETEVSVRVCQILRREPECRASAAEASRSEAEA